MSRPKGGRRTGFNFTAGRDNAFACAADQRHGTQGRAQGFRKGLGLVSMLSRNKEEGHINTRRPHLLADGFNQVISCSLGVTLAGQGGGKSQR